MTRKSVHVLSGLIGFALVMATLAGCGTTKSSESGAPQESTKAATINKVEGTYLVDVAVRAERIEIDENTGRLIVFFRVANTIYPAGETSLDKKAGAFHFRKPAGSGYIRSVSLALAPTQDEVTEEIAKKLVFGEPSLEPTTSLKTGFNEIDLYGSGRVELIARAAIEPESLPRTADDARAWLKDVAADRKLVVSYELSAETAPNKEISADITITIPEGAFGDEPAIIGTYGL